MTKLVTSIPEWQNIRSTFHQKTVGFVPTMGALHQGHLTLLEKSKSENDITVCSIFVNPTQFNNREDLEKYPRNLESDLKMISALDVDYLLSPNYGDIYPDNFKYKVTENDFSKNLCGKFRPGHFDGVLTVVIKLLNLVKATRAYFGEKDYQQLQLIKGMVDAFFMDVQIIPVATVRETSGLAMSSRNSRLSPEGVKKAEIFAKTLSQSKELSEVRKNLEKENIEIEYLETFYNRNFAAVHIDGVRLIDNV